MAFISGEKKSFLHSKISDNFGLSIDTVAKNVKGQGRFKGLLNDNTDNIKKVLNIVKDEGMSYAFFGAYEINEGYVDGLGWLNHTNQQGDAYEDAKAIAKKMVEDSKNTGLNPSWIDAGNPVDFVPEDIKKQGNEDFKSMPSGTIGRAYIPNTAAATWDAYYPNGLKQSYNEVQDYGAPLTDSIESIKNWGGTIGKSDNDNDEKEKDNDDKNNQQVKGRKGTTRYIGLRKDDNWEDRSFENFETVKSKNKGQNRVRKNGDWRQAPKMLRDDVDE